MSDFTFTVHATDGAARAGVISTVRGEIRTPTFMPLGTGGTVKAMLPESVREGITVNRRTLDEFAVQSKGEELSPESLVSVGINYQYNSVTQAFNGTDRIEDPLRRTASVGYSARSGMARWRMRWRRESEPRRRSPAGR